MTRAAQRQSELLIDVSVWRCVVLAVGLLWASQALAQPADEGHRTLVRQISQRFDVLPLRDGIALRPKGTAKVQSVEITGGDIAIDGEPVTGRELREKIGRDAAELVLQLSYLDGDTQRALFSDRAMQPAEAPSDQMAERMNRRRRASQSDRVRIGGSVTVEAGEVITGDVVAIGGSAMVDGEVHGDVVSFGGSIELGPQAIVRRNAIVIGGKLQRASGARVDGDVKEIGWGMLPVGRSIPGWWTGEWWHRGFGSPFELASTVIRAAVLCLFAALVVLLAGSYVDRASRRAAAEPFKAGLIGFLAQLLFFPLLIVTCVVLFITVIGWPLLLVVPFVCLALVVVSVIGFTAVAHYVGSRLSAALGGALPGPYVTTMAGIGVILSPIVVARMLGVVGVPSSLTSGLFLLGFFVEYAAWTVGFGAVALLRFGKVPPSFQLPGAGAPN